MVHFVVLHMGSQRMECVISDRGSDERRKINFTWRAKEPTSTPPRFWLESVYGEIGWQERNKGKPWNM